MIISQVQEIAFDPADAKAALAQLPTAPAVFALYGAEAHAEPYIGRTPNLRGRLERLLQPSEMHPRRLQLAGRVRQIRWRLTGSEFEGLLAQFSLLEAIYGPKALERMHLGAPSFVRFLGSNAYPRITVTNRPSQREAAWSYGPFPSRAAAERYADEALKLFLLRRCTEELAPRPDHPGCVYSEMKMCLAPCYQGCTDERYTQESSAVERFLATRGESRLVQLRTERDTASANLEFESAAAVHSQVQRVESVRSLAAELVRPLAELHAVILQASATPGEVSVFLYENGSLRGPQSFSTQGMRIQNENSGSTSLFAHPMAIEAIPESQPVQAEACEQTAIKLSTETDEQASKETAIGPACASERALYHGTTLVVPQIHLLLQNMGFSPSTQADEEGHLQVADKINQGPEAPEHDFSRAVNSSMKTEALAPEGNSLETAKPARGLLEARMEAVLTELSKTATISPTQRQGHLALLKRWYYRPEARRAGEIFFPTPEARWPIKALLRGVGRVAGKMLAREI